MQADFAQSIDPIFEHALALASDLEAGIERDAPTVRSEILSWIDSADRRLGTQRRWLLARYAIVVWIDELLLSMPWDGAAWWRDSILEMHYYQSRLCSLRFFELADEASGLSDRDALEVFYNCVLLGFRGMYAASSSMAGPSRPNVLNHRFPPTIGQWIIQTRQLVELAPQPAWLDSQPQLPRAITGAPPDFRRQQVVWWSIAVAILLLVNGVIFRFLYPLG